MSAGRADDAVAPTAGELPLGLSDVARRLGVPLDTASQWRKRGRLPAPDGEVGGRPAWWPSTIDRWARETGRA